MADNKVNSGLLEFSENQKVFVALDAETSEVKKAVTIDGDGLETDIGGGGGGDVTVEALSVTENGTYSEEGKAYSPVPVNVAGAASDFSTAEVTINWDASEPDAEFLKDNCPMIYRGDSDEEAPYIQGLLGVTTSPVVVEVPLYKGKCYWDLLHRAVTVTGNIEELNDGYLITGDGTITIS